MTKINPEHEKARLAARYAAMEDFELEKVGRDPAALTTWARSALLEEMKKRGLEWKPESRTAKPVDEGEILTQLGTYSDRNAAGLDRDFLADAGIKTFFYEEQPAAGTDSCVEPKEPKEIRLLVRAKDIFSARQRLTEKYPADLPVGDQADDGSPDPTNRPVVLRRYRDMPTAFIEKGVLDAAGIKAFLQDDNVVRMDWLWPNAMGGIKLIVREKDAEEAEAILSQKPVEEQGGTGAQGA